MMPKIVVKSKYFRIALAILPALVVFGAVLATSNPHDWTSGLVGYWSFDGQYTTSTNGTRDVSNNGNWGTFNGGVKPVAGISGQALSFDGVDDYVAAGNDTSLQMSTAFTAEFWITLKRTANYEYIISKGGANGAGNDGWWIQKNINSTNVSLGISSSTSYWEGVGTTLTLDTPTHIVITYSAGTATTYKNGGSPVTLTGAPTSVAGASLRNLTFGNHYNGSSYPTQGILDEVRIYNRALSANEVKQHYDQTKRNVRIDPTKSYKLKIATSNPHDWSSGLVGYWPFDGQYTTSTNGTRDVSNNSNWGAFNGGVKPVAGIVGQALSFDGVNDQVTGNLPNQTISTTTVGTVETWVNFPDFSRSDQPIVGVKSTGHWLGVAGYYNNIAGEIYGSSDGLSCGGATATCSNYSGKTCNISAFVNQWTHLAMTFDGATDRAEFYVNGVNVGYKTWYDCDIGATQTFQIGGVISVWTSGLIDEVRIYNRALGADEVMMHYQQTRRNLTL